MILIKYPPKCPLKVHISILNYCNLNCEKCYYKNENKNKLLSLTQIEHLFKEWKKKGIKSIAIGGGEPLLHPDIIEITRISKRFGFFTAVTTNGTILKRIFADRIHISADELHPTFENLKIIQKAINYYKNIGIKKVGINHIMTTLRAFKKIKKLKNVDNILLIKEKPENHFNWYKIKKIHKYWLDSCLCDIFKFIKCEQGIVSFFIDYELKASICSNYPKRIKYENIEKTIKILRTLKCDIRGD